MTRGDKVFIFALAFIAIVSIAARCIVQWGL